jgi:hypothetical protein
MRELAALIQPEFEASVTAATVEGMRAQLAVHPSVCALRDAVASGALAEESIREFVNALLTRGRGEARFPYDAALQAIAVSLEDRYSSFAEEYLVDLARVRAAHFSIAARTARACLRHRLAATRNLPPRVESHVENFPSQVSEFSVLPSAIDTLRSSMTELTAT